MLNVLDEFIATAHPLGSEVILDWTFPADLSDEYQLVIFRRRGSAVTDEEIAAYQSTAEVASGLFVYSDIDSNQIRYYNYDCENGVAYHYAACIENTTTGVWAAKKTASVTTGFSAAEGYVDSKTVIIEAIKRVMSNYNAESEKDFIIQKAFSLLKPKQPLIVVIRQASNDAQRLWGDVLDDTPNDAKYGKIEQDNITVVWEDVSSDRRDNMTNIFRINEVTLKNYILKSTNAIDVRLQMGGDSLDERWQDVTMHAGEMYIQITAPVYLTYNELERKEPYHKTDMVKINTFEFAEGLD